MNAPEPRAVCELKPTTAAPSTCARSEQQQQAGVGLCNLQTLVKAAGCELMNLEKKGGSPFR